MADQLKAKQTYQTILKAFDGQNLKYTVDASALKVNISFTTNDFDVKLIFTVDAERDLVRVLSFLPVTFPEDKRVEGAVATCIANHDMVDGSFDYDFTDGDIAFKMANSYRNGSMTTDAVSYMLNVALGTVDRYNDRFYDLAKGRMTIGEFVAKEN